jgi:hypothetical protein
LSLQQLIEIGRGRGWEELAEAILTAQYEGGVDHILDETRALGLHTLPGAKPHTCACCRFLLCPTARNPADTNGSAEFQAQLFGCF